MLWMLDASKAFDRVNHLELFKTLRAKGVCPTLLKLLFNMYSKQNMSVRWDNEVYKRCKARNGVKQGGVIFPVLFTLYLYVLMDMLKSSGFSFYVGNIFSGAVAYADDIVLLAPSKFSLNQLLKQCPIFSDLYQLDFNPNKSELVIHTHTQLQDEI